jgi:peptidyl-prolyl cis-trans isomerase C
MAEAGREPVRSTGAVIAILKSWSREPLVHFLLIGLALFAGYRALNPEASKRSDNGRIVITDDDIRQLQISWLAQWRRPPTSEELGGLLHSRVREKVLFREAMALGLDKNDTIIRRRLAQKMEFLTDDLSALAEPTAEQLKAWFANNAGRFVTPELVSFRHLYFSPDQRGEKTRDEAAALLVKLVAAGSPEAADAADSFIDKDIYAEHSKEQVASIFGGKFARSLFELTAGVWHGPIESGVGWHLVFVESVVPGRAASFEEVETSVRSGWIEEQRGRIKQKLFEDMAARYEIVLPPDAAGQAPR